AGRFRGEFPEEGGGGGVAGDGGPPGRGRVAEAVGLVRPQVQPEPVINGVGLGAGDPSDFGDGKAAGHQKDSLEPPKGAEVGGPRQGPSEALPIVVVEAGFIGGSWSSHRSSLPRRAILWQTFGYLLSEASKLAE